MPSISAIDVAAFVKFDGDLDEASRARAEVSGEAWQTLEHLTSAFRLHRAGKTSQEFAANLTSQLESAFTSPAAREAFESYALGR